MDREGFLRCTSSLGVRRRILPNRLTLTEGSGEGSYRARIIIFRCIGLAQQEKKKLGGEEYRVLGALL